MNIKFNPDLIPSVLKAKKNWVLTRNPEAFIDKCKNMSKKDFDKFMKEPLQPNGELARVNNSKTWNDYDTCMNVLKNNNNFGFLGFVLDGSDIVVVDFDHCLQDNNFTELVHIDTKTNTKKLVATEEELKEDILKADSYTEVSGSGTGLHIFILGKKMGRSVKNMQKCMILITISESQVMFSEDLINLELIKKL